MDRMIRVDSNKILDNMPANLHFANYIKME